MVNIAICLPKKPIPARRLFLLLTARLPDSPLKRVVRPHIRRVGTPRPTIATAARTQIFRQAMRPTGQMVIRHKKPLIRQPMAVPP